jgi:uncharacterized membrane protein YGL010W
MRKIDQLLYEYGLSHQNQANKLIHWICVPLIFFSIVGLIWSIPHQVLNEIIPIQPEALVNWATLALLLVLIYYLMLSFPLFLGMLVVAMVNLYVCYLVDTYLDIPLWIISLIVFFLAWIGQFYGHKVEGKKPSFLRDIQFLLIGPAWLMHFIFKKLGISY